MNPYTEEILRTDCKIVMTITGGGTTAISELLKYGGASNNLIAAHVPYSVEAIHKQVHITDKFKYCSEEASHYLANSGMSYLNLRNIEDNKLVSLGATCSLAKNKPERGDRIHICYLCIVTCYGPTKYKTLDLTGKKNTRETEEDIVGNFILKELAEVCTEISKR